MKKFYFLFLLLWVGLLHSQCINTSQYDNIVSNNSGNLQGITTCAYTDEYSTVSGLTIGANYLFVGRTGSSYGSGTHIYLTITDVNNVVIQHGLSPLLVNAITVSTIRMHYSDNATCGQSSACHNGQVQLVLACPAPISLNASGLTSNSANLGWTGLGTPTDFDVQWGATGFILGSGTIVTGITTNTYLLSGLTPATTYQFYVRANCGINEQSPWAGPFSFTTSCVPLIPPTLEEFNSFTSAATPPPACWSIADNGTPATGPTGGTINNYWWGGNWRNTANTPNGTAARFNIWTTNRQGWLISPLYDLSAGGYSVFYDVAAVQFAGSGPITGNNGNMGPDDEFRFMMTTDNGATWTTLELFNEANTPPVNGTTRTYDISTVNSSTVRFAFYANSGPTNSPSTDYDVFVDNFSVASCLPPTSLTTSGITTTSVNLNWVASISNPANGYEWEVRTSGAAGSGATGLVQSGSVAAGVTTVAVSALTSATNYQFYVRSVCSGTDNSVWIQGPNFTTLCNPVTEFTQNFDTTTTGTLPVCWSRAGNGSVGNVVAGAVAPFSAPNQLQLSAVFQSTVSYVLMPPVSNLQAETHRLRFRAFSTSAGRFLDVGYFTDEADLSTFTLLESIPMPSTTVGVSEEIMVMPTGIPAGVSRLVFRNLPSEAGTAVINIDNVIWQPIPSCFNPTFLNANNVLHNSAQLQWTPNAGEFEWDIKYGAPGFNPLTEGTLVAGIFDNPYTLTGLTGATNYSYYVRAVCDSGSNEVSPWEGPFNFRTKCDLVTEFSENFDALTAGANTIANCWGRLGNTATNNVVTGSVAPMSPPNRYNIVSNFAAIPPTFGIAVMPGVSNLNAGTHRLRFTAFSTTANAQISVGYLTNPDDPGSFVVLSNLTLPGTVAANAQQIFYEVPNTVPAGVNYLAIRNQSTAGSVSVFFDNVAWEAIPSCPNPTAVVASGVTATQATLSWNASVNNTSWEIEYGPTGFTQGSGTIVPASTNPFVLTGLTPATTYQFYVRGVCAGPETSIWSGVAAFTTACTSITPFYSENFSTFTTTASPPPSCWSRADLGSTTTGPQGGNTNNYWWGGNWRNTTGTPNGTVARFNIYSTNRQGWLISPVFDMSAGGYQVKYDVASTTFAGSGPITGGAMGSDDQLVFMVSTDGGATWTTQELFNAANTPPNLGTTKTYNLSSITSANVRFAFFADSGATVTGDYDVFIDNFVIEAIPQNPPVCASNVQATQTANCGNQPITISWDAVAGATGYKIVVGTTSGGTDVANNLNLGNVTSYIIDPATPGTTYYYTIIPFNLIGDAVGCTELSYLSPTTPCACIPVYTTGVTAGDRIVTFAIQGTTLNNNSGNTNTNSYSSFPASLGANYTANLVQGQSYPIDVTVGFESQAFAVWIDFNDNAIFELSERVGVTSANVNTSNVLVPNAFSITIPCNATLGTHRMRVRMVYAGTGNTIDPCTSYTFGETEDYEVTIVPIPAPTGDAVQNITAPNAPDATLANLVVTPSNVTWYASEADAIANVNALPLTTQLVDGATYWAVNLINNCSSAPFGVTVTVTLGLDGNQYYNLSYYPNPVKDVLNLVNNTTIERVEIYNLLGQQVMQVRTNAAQTSVQVGELAKGAYIVKAYAEGAEHTFKIIKN